MGQHRGWAGSAVAKKPRKGTVLWPLVWPVGAAASATLIWGALVAQSPPGSGGDVTVSLGEIVGGILLVLCTGGVGFLVHNSIKHGELIARMDGRFTAELKNFRQDIDRIIEDVAALAEMPVKQQRDADDIQRLYREAGTIDERIGSSRHTLRNEVAALVLQVEERVTVRTNERVDGLRDLVLAKGNGG